MSQLVETSDEWIRTRTGISQRHLLAPGESLDVLAAEAGQRAVEAAGVAVEAIDLIILATSSPDDLFGSAARVQSLLGATRAVAFDLTAACSGYVFGLVTAAQFIRSGTYQTILLVGADCFSRWVDWSDRRTCVLFGDGAGATLIQATSAEANALLGFDLRSDGSLYHTLTLAYQGEAKALTSNASVAKGTYGAIAMKGKEVYRFAVERVPETISKALFAAGMSVEEIDWLLLHQANQRIVEAVAERLHIPPEKVISNVAAYGNTSAASIPLALDEAVRSGQIRPGQAIATSGFGAGLSWGAAILRWN